MSFDVRNSVNSALISGIGGLQKASVGITNAAFNIAQQTTQNRDKDALLADVAYQQIGSVKKLLPSNTNDLNNDIVSLSINSLNAQASAKVLEVVKNTVGRIIDETA